MADQRLPSDASARQAMLASLLRAERSSAEIDDRQASQDQPAAGHKESAEA